MIKGKAAGFIFQQKDQKITISAPSVMVVGGLRYTKRATDLAKMLQGMITIFRPDQRTGILGDPTTWEAVRGIDGQETSFTSSQLRDRLAETGHDVSAKAIGGILGNVTRQGGVVFATCGYMSQGHHIGTESRQSLEPALIAFNVRYDLEGGTEWTVTMHVRYQSGFSLTESINEYLDGVFEDQCPEAMSDIIIKTCIPNSPEWTRNHHEGYRRWE